ncbi:MAG: hypothetical protein R3292_07630 [Alcanivorax sp.]|nr:hypothetical protein [Alcanivorax sp.]
MLCEDFVSHFTQRCPPDPLQAAPAAFAGGKTMLLAKMIGNAGTISAQEPMKRRGLKLKASLARIHAPG